MAELTMNRCIHAAVLRDLTRIEDALRKVGDGDKERLEGIQRAYAFLQSELTRHHKGEDTYLWPMLAGKGVDQALLDTMASEHQALSAGLLASRSAVDAAAASGKAADAVAAADSVAETRAVTAGHLAHEETDLEPQLIPHLDSPEWKAVEKQFRKGPPTQAGDFFGWVLDGASPAVDAQVRSMVPGPVIFILTKVFGRGYAKNVAPVWRT